jgi:nicotinamidase/pyrazinamidase
MKYDLFLIDAQNDFCDPNGSLMVPGAAADMYRLVEFMKTINFNDIHATLDTHHPYSIFHSAFWIDKNGNNPPPFTLIKKEDVDAGNWLAAFPKAQQLANQYVTLLDQGKKFSLVIWPDHCVMGTWGNNLYPIVADQFDAWEKKNFNTINYVAKGVNPYTEYYSAFKAEIPLKDPATGFHEYLYQRLKESEGKIIIAGEASNFCVKHTLRDLVNYDALHNDGSIPQKLIYLSDCCSPVPGFDEAQKEFEAFLKDRGVAVTTTKEFKPE